MTELKTPILVTGAHRSGTTWIGRILTASGQAAYISEPLNILHRPGIFRIPTQYWYTYICEQNAAKYTTGLLETLHYRYHLLAELKALRSTKDGLRMVRDLGIFLAGRLFRKRPLLKDPFALLSAPWFYREFGCQVVIAIRHPAAFASSLKRLGWSFDFYHLLSQELLMDDLLDGFRDELSQAARNKADIIGQSCLLWRVLYTIVRQYLEQHPQFILVRHEDLSINPIHEFENLYKKLSLQFSPQAREFVRKSTSTENPAELSQDRVHAVKLDSRANLANWKRRLHPSEIDRIHRLTQDVAPYFYPEEDW